MCAPGIEAVSDHSRLVAGQQQAAAHQYPGGLAVLADILLQPAYEGDVAVVLLKSRSRASTAPPGGPRVLSLRLVVEPKFVDRKRSTKFRLRSQTSRYAGSRPRGARRCQFRPRRLAGSP